MLVGLWLLMNTAPLSRLTFASAATGDKRVTIVTTQSAASSFDTAPMLTPETTVTDTLDKNVALHSYRFNAKAGEQYRVVAEVKSGSFFMSLSVVSLDLVQVLAESDGANLIDSTLHFAIPTEATYGVIVSYIGTPLTTPVPGTYAITLTRVAQPNK